MLENSQTGEFETWTFRHQPKEMPYFDGVSYPLREDAIRDMNQRIGDEPDEVPSEEGDEDAGEPA